MEAADAANAYIAQNAPWELAKDAQNDARLAEVCTVSLNVFRLLTIYLKPVLPKVAEAVEHFLRIAPLQWHDAQQLLENHDASTLVGAWAGWAQISVFRVDMGFLLAMLPPGAFIAFGLLLAARNWLTQRRQ